MARTFHSRPQARPIAELNVTNLIDLGFTVVATGGTADFLRKHGIAAERVNKVLEGRPHIVDAIKNGGVQLVFNTTEGAAALADSQSMRHAALLHKVPYYTTLSRASWFERPPGGEGRWKRFR